MTLKKAILEALDRDTLKAIADALEITEVDRRSREGLAAGLSRARRATPDRLLEHLSEAQVKTVCESLGVDATGRRGALVERLLNGAADESGGGAEAAPGPAGPAVRRGRRNGPKQVTRYTWEDFSDPASPETGHTALMPGKEQVVTLPMDNGWSGALHVGKLEADADTTVVVDMDPAIDPVLLWAGKRNLRRVPLLPLQRTEIVTESRIKQIIDRARKAAASKDPQRSQGALFADLEKTLRESDREKRVEFYTHEEGWKNKLICGDSLHVMQSLLHYEGLRGKVQMIYIDPPYGIKYDSNFQQRIDSTKNDDKDQADDVLTIKAFRDTWQLGIHSYLEYLKERLYLCRELLTTSGSVFVQIGDENAHHVREVMDEVFGASNFCSEIVFTKTSGFTSTLIARVFDLLLWYAKDKTAASPKYHPLYTLRAPIEDPSERYVCVEDDQGRVIDLSVAQKDGREPMPSGRVLRLRDTCSQGENAGSVRAVSFGGRSYYPQAGRHWSVDPERIETTVAAKGRLFPVGKSLRWKQYYDEFPYERTANTWTDIRASGFGEGKLYAVYTLPSVVERCIAMVTDPGELVVDPTCGSGTTAVCAERLGRRWITCDTSRVAVNVCRQRLLSRTFEHYWAVDGKLAHGLEYETGTRITLKTLAYDLEPERVSFVDRPRVDPAAVRVTGPFEVMSLGRYSLEDWKGYVVREAGAEYDAEPAKLENYIEVICRLYRQKATLETGAGFVHAVAESEREKIAISVGPLSGRVTARQIVDAVQDAAALGLLEVHVLGWAFEANVGEVKTQLEARGRVKVQLIMIRPDTLAEGLKITRPETLFSPLALPDVVVVLRKSGKAQEAVVTLKGVALFDRATRATDYKAAASGYVAAWYLDEDYDGDCFVDCQMFFDFKKAPNLKASLRLDIDPEEYTLQLESQPFPVRGYRRVAVKVVDVYGNESTIVKELN